MAGDDAAAYRNASLERWSRAAHGWGTHRGVVQAAARPVSGWLVDALEPQPGHRVLELAAGPGDTGFLVAELIQPGGELISSDAVEEMVDLARARARELGISNVEFRTIDAEWIDLPTASLDGVIARWGYMLLADPEAALRETRRVLRPGGRVALAAWTDPADNPWASAPLRELRAMGLMEAPDLDAPNMFAFRDPARIRGLLEETGFTDIAVEQVDILFRYRGPRRLVGRPARHLDDARRRGPQALARRSATTCATRSTRASRSTWPATGRSRCRVARTSRRLTRSDRFTVTVKDRGSRSDKHPVRAWASPRGLASILLVALVYVAAAKGGLALAYENSSVTAVWPPTGIALAVLVLGGPRLWPGVALGAVLANSWTGLTAPTVLAIATGNTLEAVAGAYLLRALRFRPALERLRDVLVLVLAGALCTLVSATIGVLSLRLGGYLDGGDLGSVWRTWWLGDFGGALLVAPVLLVLRGAVPPVVIDRRRVAEALALAAAAVLVSIVVFSESAPLEYLVLPIVIWGALRFRQVGAVFTSLAIATVAATFTASGLGPFVRDSPDASLLLSQTFIGIGAVIGLVLAAVTTERAAARQELVGARDDLEAQVRDRTAALASIQAGLMEAQQLAQIGSWEWDVAADKVTWSAELYRIYGVDPHEHEATFGGYLQRVHPEDRERVQATIGAALGEARAFQFDERIVRPDGAIRTLASRGQVFTGADGQPARMVGICQDVTEARRSERALRESEERARRIIEAASDAFIATDADGRHHGVEPAGRGALRLDPRRGDRPRAWPRCSSPRATIRATAGTSSSTSPPPTRRGPISASSATSSTASGHEFLVELTISPVLTETGHTINIFMHDITARRRRERYLATEHEVSRVLLESRTPGEARPAVLRAVGTGLGWAAGGWWTVDRERRRRCAARSSGATARSTPPAASSRRPGSRASRARTGPAGASLGERRVARHHAARRGRQLPPPRRRRRGRADGRDRDAAAEPRRGRGGHRVLRHRRRPARRRDRRR